ncbi:MAG: HEPN domain-containing protein [Anaerolineae bacterium]
MTEPAYEKWLRRARSNLAIAKTGQREDVMFEDLCFEAQQAAEKALKALLLCVSGDYPRTHAFTLLLAQLQEHLTVPASVHDVVELSDYAVQVRYPGDYYPVSNEEYESALAIAERTLRWVTAQIQSRRSQGAKDNDA